MASEGICGTNLTDPNREFLCLCRDHPYSLVCKGQLSMPFPFPNNMGARLDCVEKTEIDNAKGRGKSIMGFYRAGSVVVEDGAMRSVGL
ncbi:hypothetical protein NC651_036858 [Populus alba x Populus x berolinensis]|nr:hypothetical protein NC651_036858 [Populus alba x Populus x berolinensis]